MIRKQLPNLITLLNLFFGCIAIVYVLQSGLMITYNQVDTNSSFDSQLITVKIPEQLIRASLFIGLAAIVDFFDGFIARLLKASSEIGKQLDSLSDLVSFGVAPGLIVYQFLKLSYAQQVNGLDVNTLWLLPAFIIPCAGAYRLARFNIDEAQAKIFKGVPIPAAGLMLASFPLIYRYTNLVWQFQLLQNKWFWYIIILVVSYLMVSPLPMLSLKFKSFNLHSLMPFIIIAAIAVISIILLQWMAVPVIFAAYVIVSLAASPGDNAKQIHESVEVNRNPVPAYIAVVSALLIVIGCFMPWIQLGTLFKNRGMDNPDGAVMLVTAVIAGVVAVFNLSKKENKNTWVFIVAGLIGGVVFYYDITEINSRVNTIKEGVDKLSNLLGGDGNTSKLNFIGSGLFIVLLGSVGLILSGLGFFKQGTTEISNESVTNEE